MLKPKESRNHDLQLISCFDPITGGRVSEIVKQQNKSGCSWCLPLSQEEDKFEKFCNTYQGFIKVPSAYETFFEKWERAKSKNPPSSGDGKKSNILLGHLVASFGVISQKRSLSRCLGQFLCCFWYFIFAILAFIKAKDQGEDPSPVPHYELIICGAFFVPMVLLSIGIHQMGIYSLLQSLGMQG